MIDAALKTDDVLTRAIDDLDLRDLLANLDDPDDLNAQIEAAVTEAVKDSLLDRLRDLIWTRPLETAAVRAARRPRSPAASRSSTR